MYRFFYSDIQLLATNRTNLITKKQPAYIKTFLKKNFFFEIIFLYRE